MVADVAPYGLIENGALWVRDGRIHWVGAESDLPPEAANLACERLDGALITPGLIDCHTHLVYAGDRAAEFEMRLNGASYEEIARAGGGILSTVRATRAADEVRLMAETLPRLAALMREGVTTVEIKSGYGLEVESEARCLRVARRLGQTQPIRIATTFLGAHAVPPEYAGRSGDYVRYLVDTVLPTLAAEGLVDAVDGFCEGIGFSPDEIRVLFDAAQALGLPVKLHAEQLSNLQGAALTASYGGLSADHLEYLDEAGIAAMKAAGTVAVLLPGAFYYLRETKLPPVGALEAAGVPIALSTDCNPGTSPITSIQLILNMACTLWRMTPEAALAGVTRHAARALGLQDQIGTLEVGKQADFCVWNASHPAALSYAVGLNPLVARYFGGHA
ncbi:MAG: imidazolonepropionase [Asticcacaulis sp.]